MGYNIALIGYRGVGKTTIGKHLAITLKMSFIDIDEQIEQEQGRKIAEIFANEGETFFRKLESEKIEEICYSSENTVIATGGGVISNWRNMFFIKSTSIIVYFDCTKEIIITRLKEDDSRPSLTNRCLDDEVKITLEDRKPLYEKYTDLVVEVSNNSVDQVVEDIIYRIPDVGKPSEPELIDVNVKQLNSYTITIQDGAFNNIPKQITSANKYLIITDSTVKELYGKKLKKLFLQENKQCTMISFPAGEKNKNLNSFKNLHQSINFDLDRHSCIIALGGGVVGDLGGFVASTYMRGIPFVQIPTTLLAMVDSSIGGKLGVNLGGVKNIVGTFNNPEQVFIDPLFLFSLPRDFLLDGLSEVVKHALIENPSLLNFINNNIQDILELNMPILKKLIVESIKIKLNIINGDELEYGKRKLLNFGHTIGHALESTAKGKLSHGIAISIGIIAESFISKSRGLLLIKDFDLLRESIFNLGLPISLASLNIRINCEDFIKTISFDKKTFSSKTTFVLLRKIGVPVFVDDVTDEELMEALEYVK